MNEASANVDAILEGKDIWERYVVSLIVDFRVQPSEAWRMSIAEYWALHGYRFDSKPKSETNLTMRSVEPIDKQESQNMFAEMRAKGLIP